MTTNEEKIRAQILDVVRRGGRVVTKRGTTADDICLKMERDGLIFSHSSRRGTKQRTWNKAYNLEDLLCRKKAQRG
jgi:hypothetical protein